MPRKDGVVPSKMSTPTYPSHININVMDLHVGNVPCFPIHSFDMFPTIENMLVGHIDEDDDDVDVDDDEDETQNVDLSSCNRVK